MLVDDEEQKAPVVPCAIPGCVPLDDDRALIWQGKRLCYGHFADFAEHELSEVCSKRGAGPTPEEWTNFVNGLKARAA